MPVAVIVDRAAAFHLSSWLHPPVLPLPSRQIQTFPPHVTPLLNPRPPSSIDTESVKETPRRVSTASTAMPGSLWIDARGFPQIHRSLPPSTSGPPKKYSVFFVQLSWGLGLHFRRFLPSSPVRSSSRSEMDNGDVSSGFSTIGGESSFALLECAPRNTSKPESPLSSPRGSSPGSLDQEPKAGLPDATFSRQLERVDLGPGASVGLIQQSQGFLVARTQLRLPLLLLHAYSFAAPSPRTIATFSALEQHRSRFTTQISRTPSPVYTIAPRFALSSYTLPASYPLLLFPPILAPSLSEGSVVRGGQPPRHILHLLPRAPCRDYAADAHLVIAVHADVVGDNGLRGGGLFNLLHGAKNSKITTSFQPTSSTQLLISSETTIGPMIRERLQELISQDTRLWVRYLLPDTRPPEIIGQQLSADSQDPGFKGRPWPGARCLRTTHRAVVSRPSSP
ncbi:hypothetical protein B0H17DRAFT_1185701 [Mycena rosella]|uniref:Uncharacterized protein n=1 Tax=Mycena rosella TaxID=1033263 RepID=A0AAD7G5L0_MYCRO|nr:hypothetical protein B0H17DRAFT_1185701 [Mycena rosella]